MDEAWDEFFLWNDVPDDVAGSQEFGTTFDPFFVFAFVPDSAADELPAGWPTEPVALHFLHHEVESAPEFHREFIEQACKSPASFFVVEAVAPGRALDTKDALTGRRFHVLEQSASQTLKVGVIRRPCDTGVARYLVSLANRRLQPLGHLTAEGQVSPLSTQAASRAPGSLPTLIALATLSMLVCRGGWLEQIWPQVTTSTGAEMRSAVARGRTRTFS